jgi:iron(III) transport system substrate-binding protein
MNPMSRRRFVAVTVTGLTFGTGPRPARAAGPVLPSPAQWQAVLEAARKEGEVVFYSSGVARTEEPLMKDFERQYGIRVQYSRPGGGEVVIRKVQTELEAGRALADLCTLTDKTLGMYAEGQGWTAEMAVPNVASILPAFPVTSAHLVPTGFFGLPIIYNRNLLKPEDAPKGYRDLVEPRFKDKLALGAPENAASTTLVIKGWLELYGWDFVVRLKANNTSETRLQTEAAQAVARGEKLLTVGAQVWAYLFGKQGAPLGVVWPADGVVMAETTMFIARKAPHPNAARVLANHLLSAEYQTHTGPRQGAYAAVSGVPAPDTFPSLAAIKIHRTRLDELMAQRGEILDRWRKTMG